MTESTTTSPLPKRLPLWRRRWLRRFTILILLLVVVWQVLPQCFAPIIRRRLQRMIASQLDATVTIGRVTYSFPYGVTAHNIRLTSRNTDGKPFDLLKLDKINFSLARLPFKKRPLLIRNITLSGPAIHLIQTADGIVGFRHSSASTTRDAGEENEWEDEPEAPADEDADTTQPATQTAAPTTATTTTTRPAGRRPLRLSQMFELRHLQIDNASITYEDRQSAHPHPIALRHLALDLGTEPRKHAIYSFSITLKPGPLGQLSAEGDFNIDHLDLNVTNLNAQLSADPALQDSPFPPKLQAFITKNAVKGKVDLHATGRLPMRDPRAATFSADLSTADARGQFLGVADRLAFKLHAISVADRITTQPSADPDHYAVRVNVESFQAGLNDSSLTASAAALFYDVRTRDWKIDDLKGSLVVGKTYAGFQPKLETVLRRYEPHGRVDFNGAGSGQLLLPLRPNARDGWALNVLPRGFAFLPPNFPRPITGVQSGSICITPDLATFQKIEAHLGADRILITEANLELSDIKDQVRFRTIDATVTLSGKDQLYPRWLQPTIDQTHPAGVFRISGSTFTERDKKPPRTGFKFLLSTDDAEMALTPRRLPVSHVLFDAVITPDACEVLDNSKTGLRGMHGSAFGGEASGVFTLKYGKEMIPEYNGQVSIKNVDIEQAAKAWTLKDEVNPKLKGKATAQIIFAGRGRSLEHKVLDSFQGTGSIDITEGDFWSAPVIQTILGQMKLDKVGLAAGEGGVDFTVDDKTVVLKQAAISAPLLGLQGGGSIGFDGSLDLHIVAAPLSDWRDKIKSTKIPILNTVGAELFGGLQRLINTAQGALLYDFHVTGTLREYKLNVNPVPILTEGAAALFGTMLKGEHLHDKMHK